MKKIILGFIILALLIVIFFASLKFLRPKGNFPVPTPTSGPTPTLTNEKPFPTKIAVKCSALTVVSPKDNAIIGSQLTLKVIVDNTKECHWTVFEAQAGIVEITDGLGNLLGKGVLKTTEEWTKATPTTYTTQLQLKKAATSAGTITISEENPSGKPDAQKYTIPVSF